MGGGRRQAAASVGTLSRADADELAKLVGERELNWNYGGCVVYFVMHCHVYLCGRRFHIQYIQH